jgi:translation initiation factor IF-3
VIDEEGQKLGEFMTRDAVQMARDRELDLVEVAPNARPPVCRIADYGKMKYEKQKRDAAARKRQHQVQIKEIKLRPKTDDHDMDVKIKHAQRFIIEGNKVKVTVRFRGREHAHHEIGAQQCMRIAENCKEIAVVEMTPRMDGRQMTMIIAPTAAVAHAAAAAAAAAAGPAPLPQSTTAAG